MEKLIEQKEIEISKLLGETNAKKVFENFVSFSDTSGSCNTYGIWSLKKKIFPSKKKLSILAKKNENGKLVTNPTELNSLGHRKIKPGFENLKILKEYLCSKRLELTMENKAPRLTRLKLDKVLKKLKNNKARDPHGFINEIFKLDAIEGDFKESLFLLCSKIKDTLKIPYIIKYANITSIHKGRGAKNDIQNERGIICINIFRSILLKFIYDEEYENIDKNMFDSNVWGRKRKNIRNHLFILNGIINEAVRNNANIDLEILDFKQCFDSMWLEDSERSV